MNADDPELLNGLTLDEVLRTWFKYDTRSGEPEFVLITGTSVCGKTRLRHEQFAQSHVNVDAGDIFRRLEGERVLDFPGVHRGVLDLCGRIIAETAIRERFNVVTEVHFIGVEKMKALVDAMLAAGYRTRLVALECDWEEAERRNRARGPHNISAYRTDEFNVRWLMEAAGKFAGRAVH